MAYKSRLLTLAESGTGAALTASNGGILYSNASTAAVLAGTATANQVLLSGASTTPAWSTATYPATAGTSGNVLTSNGTNWTSAAPAAAGSAIIWFMNVNGSPADATTYFFELGQTFTLHTASNLVGQMIYMPRSGTITAFYGNFTVSATLGSNENCTLAIRLNNTTDTNISTTIQLTSALVTVSNSALNIAVAAGDYIEYKFISPTWTTNPTNVAFQGSINIT